MHPLQFDQDKSSLWMRSDALKPGKDANDLIWIHILRDYTGIKQKQPIFVLSTTCRKLNIQYTYN